MSFEKNTINSFRKVREDMENLQHQISELKQKIEDIDAVLLGKEKAKKKTAGKKAGKKRR